jgi:transcriptional regulator CtsR
MSMFGNDLVSTPAASRGGTAQSHTPRSAATKTPQSVLKKSGNQALPALSTNQVLPAVSSAIKKKNHRRKEVGITFHDNDDFNSTRAIAARQAQYVKPVGVEKIISVTGHDVTDKHRFKPRSSRKGTGVLRLDTGEGGWHSPRREGGWHSPWHPESPLRDRGITFGDQHDGGRLAETRQYKPTASAAHRYRKPTGNTPPGTPQGYVERPEPPPPFPARSWQVRRQREGGGGGFVDIEKAVRKERQALIQQVEHQVVAQMTRARAAEVQLERQEARFQATVGKEQLLNEHRNANLVGRLEQKIAKHVRQQQREPPPDVVRGLREREWATQAHISNAKVAVYMSKASVVQGRKREVERGKVIIEKTKQSREEYFGSIQDELRIKRSLSTKP